MDKKNTSNSYPGGKGSSGTYQKICNTIPFHKLFVEPFAGLAKVSYHKKQCDYKTILVEKNEKITLRLKEIFINQHVKIIHKSAFDYLEDFIINFKSWYPDLSNCDVVIYFDPPYLHDTRSDNNLYGRNFELSNDEHLRLISIIVELALRGFNVMVSHYEHKLYDRKLNNFNSFKYMSMTRHGLREEKLYYNFPYPVWNKHEYTFAGENYREREQIRQKAKRYVNKFISMPELQKAAIVDALYSNELIKLTQTAKY
ncbi:MAG: hypothetical protein PF448_06440 [Bacteroidales bacterium]|jgi:DNA adenine methylase|nr:hypothetical protein [Bacteroidales bacterium]